MVVYLHNAYDGLAQQECAMLHDTRTLHSCVGVKPEEAASVLEKLLHLNMVVVVPDDGYRYGPTHANVTHALRSVGRRVITVAEYLHDLNNQPATPAAPATQEQPGKVAG